MVALRCGSEEAMDTFLLHKVGSDAPPQRLHVPGSAMAAQATFTLGPVTSAHGATYRCYGTPSTDPYLWSWRSDPLQLEVSGEGPSPVSLVILVGAGLPTGEGWVGRGPRVVHQGLRTAVDFSPRARVLSAESLGRAGSPPPHHPIPVLRGTGAQQPLAPPATLPHCPSAPGPHPGEPHPHGRGGLGPAEPQASAGGGLVQPQEDPGCRPVVFWRGQRRSEKPRPKWQGRGDSAGTVGNRPPRCGC
uniref:Immunoglobulin domain-containing protein n=1 Tax=Oryctolagus cuniculus TaxID=9986 RepID=G1SRU8_RABIT